MAAAWYYGRMKAFRPTALYLRESPEIGNTTGWISPRNAGRLDGKGRKCSASREWAGKQRICEGADRRGRDQMLLFVAVTKPEDRGRGRGRDLRKARRLSGIALRSRVRGIQCARQTPTTLRTVL